MIENIHFLSMEKAMKVIPKTNASIISITNPGDKPVTLKNGWGNILRLEFLDWETIIPRNKTEQHTINSFEKSSSLPIESLVFKQEQAVEIIQWLEQIEIETCHIYVHCLQGISRSSAIAKFISEKYSLPFDENYNAYNKFVYSILGSKFC